jgi:hypothetical protein
MNSPSTKSEMTRDIKVVTSEFSNSDKAMEARANK